MATLIVCQKCKSEYVVSENYPDPCSLCGELDPRFSKELYVEQIRVIDGVRHRQLIRRTLLTPEPLVTCEPALKKTSTQEV